MGSPEKVNKLSASQKFHSFSCDDFPKKKVPLSSLKKNSGTTQSLSRISGGSSKDPINRVSRENLHVEENVNDIQKILAWKQSPKSIKSVSLVENDVVTTD